MAVFRHRRELDVVFVSGFRVMGMTLVPLCRRLGVPCILKSDSLGELSGTFFRAGLKTMGLALTSRPVRFGLERRKKALLRADRFVSISSAVESEYQAQGVPGDRIVRIPNSVDTDRFSPADSGTFAQIRRRLDLDPDEVVVTYTGRLVSYKGLPLLMRVWERIVKLRPDVRLLLVGDGGLDIHNCEDELRAFVAGRGLDERVRFCGRVRDVETYLRASDIFAFPTESEAFGISLIEAMACGLPVVATRVGGVVDIVENGVDGILVDSGREKDFETALLDLLSDPARRRALGERARITVVQKFSEKAVIGQYENLFASLNPQKGIKKA